MKPFALPLGLALLAGCTNTPQPYAPVRDLRYSAVGEQPFWLLAIGDDRILLRLGEAGGEAIWPRTLPRTVDNVRRWESGEGTNVIAIEARPGPCTGSGGRQFEDNVIVRLSGRELTGCGGRLIGERN